MAPRAWLEWYFAPRPDLSPGARRWNAVRLYFGLLAVGLHLALVPLFAALGVPVMVWFNVGSTVFYTLVSVIYRLGRVRLSRWLIVTEVLAHAALATQQIGWDSGFFLPVFVVSSVLVGKVSRLEKALWSAVVIATFVALRMLGAPAVILGRSALLTLDILNCCATFALLMLMSSVLDDAAERLEVALVRKSAQTEALLKNEVSHQVAERSREIGKALVRNVTEPRPVTLVIGTRFQTRYQIVGVLGAGGMGAVYEVERLTDHHHLALKVLTGNVSSANAARFAREAEIGARVHHANLVSIIDVGIADGAPFLVMELVTGGSLEERRERFGDVGWALPILRGIAQGLVALHDAGVVHRDLKPANILLSEDQVKISDFGISRFDTASVDSVVDPAAATVEQTTKHLDGLTGTGAILGTPHYMAPEAGRGGRALSAPADVFAFGIVAYELMTKRAPFAMPPVLLAMAGHAPPVPASLDDVATSREVKQCILACLATDPEKRPTARAILDVLRA